jgi:hypothetical protein
LFAKAGPIKDSFQMADISTQYLVECGAPIERAEIDCVFFGHHHNNLFVRLRDNRANRG